MKYLLTLIAFCIASSFSTAQNSPSYASSTFSFPVSDIDKATQLYQSVLGEVECFSPAEKVIEFKLNDQTWLQLFEGDQSHGAVLRLEVANIQLQHQRLKNLGLTPTAVELVPSVVSYFDFSDPDGNQLSFYELE